MKKTSLAVRAAAAAALASTALAAGAGAGVQVLTQNNFANAGAPATIATGSTTGGLNNGTHYAGEFTGVFGADSFLSYCVDLRQFFSFGTHYTDYAATTGTALFGAAKALQLGEFLTAVGGFAAGTPSRSAAVQAGLWEILYETGPALALGSGSFTAGGGTTLASDIAAIDGFLSHLGDYAATPFAIYASPTAQDFITAAADGGRFGILAVPEPSGLALAALALAGAVHTRRHRRARTKA